MTKDNSLGTITIDPDTIIKCMKLNDTIGVDNRVIRLFKPFSGSIKTDVHREFKGTERYSNPKSAPMHVAPEVFVAEEEFRSIPYRDMVDVHALDIPEDIDDRSDEEQELFNEAYDEVLDVWESDVRMMLVDRLVIEPVYPDEETLVFDVEYTQ